MDKSDYENAEYQDVPKGYPEILEENDIAIVVPLIEPNAAPAHAIETKQLNNDFAIDVPLMMKSDSEMIPLESLPNYSNQYNEYNQSINNQFVADHSVQIPDEYRSNFSVSDNPIQYEQAAVQNVVNPGGVNALRTVRLSKCFVDRGNWHFEWQICTPIASHIMRITWRSRMESFSQTHTLSVFVDARLAGQKSFDKSFFFGSTGEYAFRVPIDGREYMVQFNFNLAWNTLDTKDITLLDPERHCICEYNHGIIRGLWQPEAELYCPEETVNDPESTGRQIGGGIGLIVSAAKESSFSRPASRLSQQRLREFAASSPQLSRINQMSTVSQEEMEERRRTQSSNACCKLAGGIILIILGFVLLFIKLAMISH